MRLIDADALAAEVFDHRYPVDILENEHKVLGDVLTIIHNAPTVCESCKDCNDKQFTENMVENIAKVMIENGITDFDELAKRLRGGKK